MKNKKRWSWEQECENSINLKRDGAKIAEIITERELDDEDYATAKFIVKACNAAEK